MNNQECNVMNAEFITITWIFTPPWADFAYERIFEAIACCWYGQNGNDQKYKRV